MVAQNNMIFYYVFIFFVKRQIKTVKKYCYYSCLLYRFLILKERHPLITEKLFKIGLLFGIKQIINNCEKFKVVKDFNYNIVYCIESNQLTNNITPNIVNLGIMKSHLCYTTLPPRLICKFKDVCVRPNSSFIYFSDGENKSLVIDKLKYKTNIKSTIAEFRYHNDDNFYHVPIVQDFLECKDAVSFMGHYSNHFGHFLIEYLEKFDHLYQIPVDLTELNILVNEQIDGNILDLILLNQKKFGFKILNVPSSKEVKVANLYTIDPISIVTDGANYSSITDKIFRVGTQQFFSNFQSDVCFGFATKLFLTRRGLRSMVNIEEVECYFKAQGYRIIDDCHEMSIKEKRSLFGKASFVVGPAGSAFFNCIWCPRNVKILNFINYEIAYDNCLQNMLSEEAEIYHLAGKEINYKFYNSDYHIELDEIIHYSKELGFTS